MDIVQKNNATMDLEKRAFQNFSDFMTRIVKFEELVSVGSEFLNGFRKHLEFLRKTSEVLDGVSKQIKSMKDDVKVGFVNVYDGKQSFISVNMHIKVNSCHKGLEEYLSKAKELLGELQCLVDTVLEGMHAAIQNLPKFAVIHSGDGLVVHHPELEEEETTCQLKPIFSEYAAVMGSICFMVKQDYAMQEKIVSSLDLNSSSEELQSYSEMWSLRPYINNDIMRQAWKFIP